MQTAVADVEISSGLCMYVRTLRADRCRYIHTAKTLSSRLRSRRRGNRSTPMRGRTDGRNGRLQLEAATPPRIRSDGVGLAEAGGRLGPARVDTAVPGPETSAKNSEPARCDDLRESDISVCRPRNPLGWVRRITPRDLGWSPPRNSSTRWVTGSPHFLGPDTELRSVLSSSHGTHPPECVCPAEASARAELRSLPGAD